MKIMIAGLGSIGRRHFRNLLALGERDILLYRTQHSTLPDDELAGYPVETELEAALAHSPAGRYRLQPNGAASGGRYPGCQSGLPPAAGKAGRRFDGARPRIRKRC